MTSKKKVTMRCGTACLTSAVALWAGSSFAQSGATTELEEIVVTATKRLEDIYKVPISMTAVGQKDMDEQGVKSLQDLARTTPGLTFRALPGVGGSGDTNIAIRGIFSTVGAPTTGVYLDDAPLQKRNLSGVGTANGTPLPKIFDMERIEVLRGPQGTLYGGSSEGGTVRLITPQPSLTDYSGYSRAEVSTMQEGEWGYELGTAFGGPLVQDRVAVRVSLWGQRTSGWIDDVSEHSDRVLVENANWEKNAIGRVALLWAPFDGLSITPSLFYSYTNRKYNLNSYMENAEGGTYTVDQLTGMPLASGPLTYPTTTQFGRYRTTNNYYTADGVEIAYESPLTNTLVLPALNITYDFTSTRLTSTTSYSRDKTDGQSGASGTDIQNFVPYSYLPAGQGPGGSNGLYGYTNIMTNHNYRSVTTEELRLSSTDDGALSWLVGAYYSSAKTDQGFNDVFNLDVPYLYFAGIPASVLFGVPGDTGSATTTVVNEKSAALFGELTFAATDKLRLTAGLRASQEKYSYTQSGYLLYAGTSAANPSHQSGSVEEKPVTPKLAVSYQITPDTMVYATAASGYRSGGTNSPVSAAFQTPASVCYNDVQALGGSPPSTYDSDSLWSYDVGAKLKLLDNRLRLTFGAYYIDWKDVQTAISLSCGYSYVRNVPGAVSQGVDFQAELRPTESLSVITNVGYTNAEYSKTVLTPSGAQPVVSKGDALPVPEWTASIGVTYERPLNQRLRGYIRGDYQYSGSWLATPGMGALSYRTDNYQQNSSDIASLRLGIRRGGWDVSLFSNNLFNDHTSLVHGKGTTSVFTTHSTYAPRTIGLTATHRY